MRLLGSVLGRRLCFRMMAVTNAMERSDAFALTGVCLPVDDAGARAFGPLRSFAGGFPRPRQATHHGVPAIANAMETPLGALGVLRSRSLRRVLIPPICALIALISVKDASPRPAGVLVARLPAASDVTICNGPLCAALLAADVMPGA